MPVFFINFFFKFGWNNVLQNKSKIYAERIIKAIIEYIISTNFDLSTNWLVGKKYIKKI